MRRVKRPREVMDFDQEHVVLTSLSPLKKGRKTEHFHGTVRDGIVAFSDEQLKKMQEFKKSKKAVKIEDYQISPG